MTVDDLKKSLSLIQSSIEEPTDGTADGWSSKLEVLVNLSGLSSECVSVAKQLWMEAKGIALSTLLEDNKSKLSPSVAMEVVKTKTGAYEAMYERAERLDKRVGSSMDSLRTLISKYKAELERGI